MKNKKACAVLVVALLIAVGMGTVVADKLCTETAGIGGHVGCKDNGCKKAGGCCVAVDKNDDGFKDTCECIIPCKPVSEFPAIAAVLIGAVLLGAVVLLKRK